MPDLFLLIASIVAIALVVAPFIYERRESEKKQKYIHSRSWGMYTEPEAQPDHTGQSLIPLPPPARPHKGNAGYETYAKGREITR